MSWRLTLLVLTPPTSAARAADPADLTPDPAGHRPDTAMPTMVALTA